MIRSLVASALRYVADLLEPEAPPDFGWAVAPEREPSDRITVVWCDGCPACKPDHAPDREPQHTDGGDECPACEASEARHRRELSLSSQRGAS